MEIIYALDLLSFKGRSEDMVCVKRKIVGHIYNLEKARFPRAVHPEIILGGLTYSSPKSIMKPKGKRISPRPALGKTKPAITGGFCLMNYFIAISEWLTDLPQHGLEAFQGLRPFLP